MDPKVEIKTEIKTEISLADRILAVCREVPNGVSDKFLSVAMPDVDTRQRAEAVNELLNGGKIGLFQSTGEEKGLLYRAVANSNSASGSGFKGDAEEKLVYRIVEEAGNKGTWIRDIRLKSNLVQTQLNKVKKHVF